MAYLMQVSSSASAAQSSEGSCCTLGFLTGVRGAVRMQQSLHYVLVLTLALFEARA